MCIDIAGATAQSAGHKPMPFSSSPAASARTVPGCFFFGFVPFLPRFSIDVVTIRMAARVFVPPPPGHGPGIRRTKAILCSNGQAQIEQRCRPCQWGQGPAMFPLRFSRRTLPEETWLVTHTFTWLELALIWRV